MPTNRISAAVLSSLFALSACGAAADKAATTTAAAATTTAAPTPTAAATTTTTAPAPAPTTIATPTTTTIAAVDQVAAIKQAILDYEVARYLCLQKPATCDPTRYATGRQAASETKFFARLTGMNLVGKRSVDDAAYYTFESVELATDLSSAIVEVCYWDTGTLATEAGAIFNEDNASYLRTITVVLEQSTWRVESVFGHQETIGHNTCGPRP
jgi:hypothetical protein